MKFDRKIFFDEYKKHFDSPSKDQVASLTQILNFFEKYFGWWDMLEQMANALAQIKRETAHSFEPCAEGYYLGDADEPGYYQGNTDRVRRFWKHLRYYPFFGRGHVQNTWEANYKKLTAYIKKYFPEIAARFPDFDLVKTPDLLFDPDVSMAATTLGMHLGLYRPGQTLDRYINPVRNDYYMAREIVNGDKAYHDKGDTVSVGTHIVNDSTAFAKCLRASLIAGSDATPFVTPDDTAESEPSVSSTSSTENLPSEPPAGNSGDSQVINVADTPSGDSVKQTVTVEADKSEEKKIEKAKQSEPVSIPAEQKVGLFSKAWGVVLGILAGTYTIPKLDLSDKQLDLLKVVAPYLIIGGLILVGIWYFTKKLDLFKRDELFVKTNTDQTTKDVVYTEPPKSKLTQALSTNPVVSFLAAAFATFAVIVLIALI
jgi:hypothetical protein